MAEIREPVLLKPFKDLSVLKENKYKKVTLKCDGNKMTFIAKTYQGHADKFSRLNTEYAHQVLEYFFEHFSEIAIIPRVYSADLDVHTVNLEFLPNLGTAALLTIKTLERSKPFFEKCYQIRESENLFRAIEDSQLYNPPTKRWVTSGKPQSLGLKGDLWQNLCLDQSNLIIADIDSASMEPLGLSEIILHAEIHAEISFGNLLGKLFSSYPTPLCFTILDKRESHHLIEIALELLRIRMRKLPSKIREVKIGHIRRILSSQANNIIG